MAKLGPYELNHIYTGDARELARAIPNESIDLIFTDPPYPKEYLPLYGWLAGMAARVLKPGGLCLALCGHFGVLAAGNLMSQHLEFYWLGGMGHNKGNAAIFPRKMWAAWKPLLWFVKPGPVDKAWTFDFFTPSKGDKRYHKWGQPTSHAAYYIDRLTNPGDKVLDPFTGGGAVPAVCKMLGRDCLAFEIDSPAADRARKRVRNTQPPLFVPQPEQLRLTPTSAP